MLHKEYGNCDYDVRHNVSAFGIYEIPFHSRHELLRQALGGWQVSETAFLQSGLSFSVLSAPYTANNNGIFQGSGPQYANCVPGVPLRITRSRFSRPRYPVPSPHVCRWSPSSAED